MNSRLLFLGLMQLIGSLDRLQAGGSSTEDSVKVIGLPPGNGEYKVEEFDLRPSWEK
jgi:hypothetical protein